MRTALPAFGVFLSIVALVLSLLVRVRTPRIAYIDTGKLMLGFYESASAERDMSAVEESLQDTLKALEDSVKAMVELMSKEYNTASPSRKKELQDLLTAENKRFNNHKFAGLKRIDEMRTRKLTAAMDKANLYVEEYGEKHGYNIIFATSSGNIVYGDRNRFDITDDIIKGLNERYK